MIILNNFALTEKNYSKIMEIPYRTHNALIHFIDGCNSISIILEKRRVKFLWNLLNSDNVLFRRI